MSCVRSLQVLAERSRQEGLCERHHDMIPRATRANFLPYEKWPRASNAPIYRLDIYYSKGPHLIFGKVVAGQPHAGLSLSAPYRHQRVPRWHTDRSVHPDVTPFSVFTA